MTRSSWLVLAVLSIACGEPEAAPSPTGPVSRGPVAPAPAPTPAPAPAERRASTGLPVLPGEGSASAARMTLDARGLPIVIVKRGDRANAYRWDGTEWRAFGGDAACDGREVEPVELVTEPDGRVALLATIALDTGANGACVLRGDGTSWTRVGDVLEGRSGGHARALALAPSPEGLVVITSDVAEPPRAFARRFDGAAWQPIGDGTLVDGTITSLTIDARDARLAVAWVQRHEGPRRTIEVRTLEDGVWTARPAIDADSDTEVQLALAPDGTILLARSWNPGFKEVLRGTGDAWASLGAPPDPDTSMPHGLPQIRVAEDGTPVLVWASDRVELRRHDGALWTPIASGLGRLPRAQSDVHTEIAADGTTWAVWRDLDTTTSEPAVYRGVRVAAR